jgi:hypothetical protein
MTYYWKVEICNLLTFQKEVFCEISQQHLTPVHSSKPNHYNQKDRNSASDFGV